MLGLPVADELVETAKAGLDGPLRLRGVVSIDPAFSGAEPALRNAERFGKVRQGLTADRLAPLAAFVLTYRRLPKASSFAKCFLRKASKLPDLEDARADRHPAMLTIVDTKGSAFGFTLDNVHVCEHGPPMANTTDGQEALLQILTPIGTISRREMASQIGVSHTVFGRWEAGVTRPEPHFRMALERIYKIPAHAWLTEDERTIAFGSEGESGSRGAVEHPGLDGATKVQFTELDEDIHVSEEIDAGGAT